MEFTYFLNCKVSNTLLLITENLDQIELKLSVRLMIKNQEKLCSLVFSMVIFFMSSFRQFLLNFSAKNFHGNYYHGEMLHVPW